jgi:hypothetical protein
VHAAGRDDDIVGADAMRVGNGAAQSRIARGGA